ncbi:DUF934 domain-containing protein [Caldimonas aquatica]|uniref:DUF934 domain-containing protein n=1 Tax=Caldimonas aquatica TaxID=376175 RepID=A0ABY6MW45_9BURK|nr:DUF934 domain-containing protein [Schlegelella aquatica]UZD56231.1 DUF934 domain-containing protein [Schlegelella aquatica]
MNFIDPLHDDWTPWADGEPGTPLPNRLLTWAQWQQVREQWPADVPVGVAFPNDADIEALEPDLPRIALVALHFPKWTDGRAYSQARLLRNRYRFSGQVRATGDVVVDMVPLLHRTGFDAAVLREGQSAEVARRLLAHFPAYYQGDVHERQPRFRRPEGAVA